MGVCGCVGADAGRYGVLQLPLGTLTASLLATRVSVRSKSWILSRERLAAR